MKLGDYLDEDFVFPDIEAKGKSEVLKAMVAPLEGKIPGFSAEKAYDVLLERENLGTTGIGDCVAIPHGKLECLEDVVVVVARSLDGVDFEALDFKPCNIFFLVLAPEQVAGLHLRILAHISRLLKDDNFRKEFMSAPDKDGLWKLLKGA